jgi:predicted DNA-binding transcriptional regulator AlpA
MVTSKNIKKYYRANELAQLLGIGLSTVWLYAKQGKITPKKLSPRVTVFDIDEINTLFDEV